MKNNLPFVGIVLSVVDSESNEFLKNDSELNLVYVVPLGFDNFENDNLETIECFFINSRKMDIPIPNEAVLCVPTDIGNFIIDIVTPSDSTNYAPLINLLSANPHRQVESSIQIDSEKVHKIILENQKILNTKFGTSYTLGRNGQYLIYDTSTPPYQEKNEDEGVYVKLGIKHKSSNSQENQDEDSSIVIAKNQTVESFLNFTQMFSEIKDKKFIFDDDFISMKSGDLVFYGENYVILYSNEIYITAKSFIVSSQTTRINSESVYLGLGKYQPVLLGNTLDTLLDKMASILQLMTTNFLATPVGTPIQLNPIVTNEIANLRIELSKKRHLSKKIFIE